MSTTTNEVKITGLFTDGTTRTYSLEQNNPEYLNYVKPRIKQLNQVMTGGDTSSIPASVQSYAHDMQTTFVSSEGAPLMQIAKGQITITEEEVIYSGN